MRAIKQSNPGPRRHITMFNYRPPVLTTYIDNRTNSKLLSKPFLNYNFKVLSELLTR